MPADDALLFIDANKYLDLYQTDSGRKLLAPLREQAKHIFVPQQVVNEVERRKLVVAAQFLVQKSKALKLKGFGIPDHLSGADPDEGKGILDKLREVHESIENVTGQFNDHVLAILDRISASEDEVSVALAPLFAEATAHTSEQLQRARERRELGNPPGKTGDALGDQLVWEQILTHFRGKRRLWIISRDSDYGTSFKRRVFLNAHLRRELSHVTEGSEVYVFENTVDGILDFVSQTGADAFEHLSSDEVQEIQAEEIYVALAEIRKAMDMQPTLDEIRKAMDMQPTLDQIREAMDMQPTLDQIREAMDMQPTLDALRKAMDMQPTLDQIRKAVAKGAFRKPGKKSQMRDEEDHAKAEASDSETTGKDGSGDGDEE